MKKKNDYKTYLICDLIIMALKALIGIVGGSLTLVSTVVYDLFANITSILALKAKEETKKSTSIFTSIYGFIIVLVSILIVYLAFYIKVMKPILLILIILLLALVCNYIITVVKTNTSMNKKEGTMGIGYKNSNVNMALYIITAISIIMYKFTKFFKYFKYSDRVGVIVIAILIASQGIKIIVNSFKHMEDKEEEDLKKTINEEVNKQKEVKNVTGVTINSIGGIKNINVSLKLQDKQNLPDLITFVVTLCDYLLKYSSYASVTLVKNVSRKGVRASAKKSATKKTTTSPTKKTTKKGAKTNAGNSRGTNSKKSTKKKNTKKKNKKR